MNTDTQSNAHTHTLTHSPFNTHTLLLGGIRCVKINAYLEQKLGFTNVSRLAGGIISYTRELEQRKLAENSEINNVNEKESDEGHGFSMISKSNNENNDEIDTTLETVDIKEIKSESNEIVAMNKNDNDQTIHLTRNIDGSKFKVI